jgi:hypothetical protein
MWADPFIDAVLILSYTQRQGAVKIAENASRGQHGELFYEAGNLTSPHAHGTQNAAGSGPAR